MNDEEENNTHPRSQANDIRAGIGWLFLDMALVAGGMTALVKAQGVNYPAFQLVFIRALIGLLFILPLIWRHRKEMRAVRYPWRNLSRICCNAIALTSNFIAIGLLPLATVNAIGFSRPLVTMALAVTLLGESVNRYRWAGACLAFMGVLVVINPVGGEVNAGILIILVSVIFGALAVIQARALRAENTTVMMVFYTVGLAAITAIPAVWTWKPVAPSDWIPLLGIGLLAQLGQYCFLQAYRKADAAILAPVSYLSLLVVTAIGYFLFNEVPEPRVSYGMASILISLLSTAILEHFDKHARKG